MNSFSGSNQGIAARGPAVVLVFFLLGLMGLVYFWAASNLASYTGVLLAVLSPCFFLISFFSIKVGLGLLTFSMLFSPEIQIGSTGVREVIIRLEDILIPLLVLAWVARLAIRREFRLLVSSPLNVPICLLLGLSVFSTIRGIFTGWVLPLPAFFYILKTVEFFSIFFLVLNYVRTESEIHLFLWFALLTVALIGIYTLTQVPSVEIFSERRITAPFEGTPEPGTVGGYIAFLLLIVISILLYEKTLPLKWFFTLLSIVLFIPLVYTLNRTSYAAFLAGMIFLSFVEKRRWLRFLLVAFLLTSPILLPHAVKERIAFTWRDGSNPGREWGVDQSFNERINTFRKVWNVWRENPFVSPFIGEGVTSLQITESQYVKTLHETGLMGLALWLWIFARLFRMSKWLFDSLEGGRLKGMVLGYRAGLVGILLHGFGAITFYIVRIMEPFWFISGLVISLYLIKVGERASVSEGTPVSEAVPAK